MTRLGSGLVALFVVAVGLAVVAAGLVAITSVVRAADGPFLVEAELDAPPAIVFETMDGERRTLEDYRGKALVLNLWATWCAPCIAEMPSLAGLARHYAETDAPIAVLALALDRSSKGKMQSFLDRLAIDGLEIVHDPTTKEGRTLGMIGMPTTIVFDAEGKERGRRLGEAEWDDEAAIAAIAAALE